MPKLLTMALAAALACGAAQAADTWKRLTKQDGLPANEIQFLKQDPTGTIWIGTNSGLGRSVGGKLEVVLKDRSAWDIYPLGPNRFLVGTGGGVVLLDGAKESSFLGGNTVTSFVLFKDKTVWAIAKSLRSEQNSLVAFDGTAFAPVEKFKNERVTGIVRASNEKVYLSVEGDGIIEVDPKVGPVEAARHLRGSTVNVMFEDSKKRLWAGLWGRGVAMYDGKNWTQYLTKEKSAVFAIVEDAKGAIWVATSMGLYRQDEQKWVNDLQDEGQINMLQVTSDGKVWISSGKTGGLRYWDGAKWVVSLESPDTMRTLLETKEKELWAGGILQGVYVKK